MYHQVVYLVFRYLAAIIKIMMLITIELLLILVHKKWKLLC